MLRITTLATALILGLALPGLAQERIGFSPDVTASLGVGGGALTVTDEDVAEDDAAGTVTAVPVGAIPANAEVNAYEFMPSGDKLLSFDTTIMLPGLPAGMPAEPRDVVVFMPGPGTYAFFFDGSAAGVPANARVDGVTLDASDDLHLSFDISVTLPGPLLVDDEDVVSFIGGVFALFYDGSANGVPPALDVDAIDIERRTGELLLSFNASGTETLSGVTFDDEDVLAFDSTLPGYAMYADSSLSDPTDWPTTDLIALPEPGSASLLWGLGGLVLLGRLRSRRSPE